MQTNVAMLAILNEMAKHRNEETGEFDFDLFKCIYIAPMKALVQEMVGNFTSRLKDYGIQIGELTGDAQMTKQQIAATQIIVTTPEKLSPGSKQIQATPTLFGLSSSTRSIFFTMTVVLCLRAL